MKEQSLEQGTIITLTTQHYFEDVLYAFGWIFLIVGFPLLIIQWYAALSMIFLGVIILTTTYKLKIDTSHKEITDFLCIMGIRRNAKTRSYKRIDHIFVKKVSYTQRLNLLSISTRVRGMMFHVYLVTDGEKIFVGESRHRNRIERKTGELASRLNTEIRYIPE